MFFIKKSEVVIDCFTDHKIVYDAFPIDYATKFYPEWWKKMDSTIYRDSKVEIGPTIKSCAGLIDYYKKGLIMPMWCDFAMTISEGSADWQFANDRFTAMAHDRREWADYDSKNNMIHIKLNSPWKFKTKSDVKWIFKDDYWNHNPFKWYSLPHGIAEFKHQHTTNVNLFFNIHARGSFVINCGEPLIHLIPFTEKKLIIKNHLISTEEFKQQFENPIISFRHSYRKLKNAIEKCPFHSK